MQSQHKIEQKSRCKQIEKIVQQRLACIKSKNRRINENGEKVLKNEIPARNCVSKLDFQQHASIKSKTKSWNLINSEKGILPTPNKNKKYIYLNGFPEKKKKKKKTNPNAKKPHLKEQKRMRLGKKIYLLIKKRSKSPHDPMIHKGKEERSKY